MRLFVAVLPPPDVVEDLDEFLSVRREHAAFRWTLPDQWHLTLAFMPAVGDRHLDELVERLDRAARRRDPMDAAIIGGGAFPNVGRAKVLWAGVEVDNPEGLRHLAGAAKAAAARSGIEVDGGRFKAHLTLARMGHPIEATNWVRLLDGYRGPYWRVQDMALVESHLGEGPRKRPRYEVLQRFGLGRSTSPGL